MRDTWEAVAVEQPISESLSLTPEAGSGSWIGARQQGNIWNDSNH
ncbi:hypothetical protein GCM10010305_60320 [Streptomyces termitum]|uniref:Uncharacterized protein n=1 Tax=Streptomyces termitum TaxID=67368 RepID=A0A918TCY0_9ACTN|nr:hypothetical protein GCM10010305_60320 [Streptomyces termitum]